MSRIGRRGVIEALASIALGAALWPRFLAAGPKDPPRTLGYLSDDGERPDFIAKPLAELGWVEGKNLRFEVRVVGTGDPAKTAAAAAELARAGIDVLFVSLVDYRVEAFAAVPRTIPIVCGEALDPVGQGLARTLQRPGANITGLSGGVPEMAEMRIGLLKAARPRLERIVLLPPRATWPSLPSLRAAAGKAGISFGFTPVATLADVERSLRDLGDPASGAAIVPPGLQIPSADICALAIRYRIATMGSARDGALMSYGLDHSDPRGRIAAIIDKIFRGASPAEIPFELPDRTHFVLNRATAKAIGVDLSPGLLLRATEVIG